MNDRTMIPLRICAGKDRRIKSLATWVKSLRREVARLMKRTRQAR